MTCEEYARHTGLTIRQVSDWARQGKIITKPKEGRKETPLVNVIAMNELATREALALLG